ncbi:MAG TPA: hypothetical protein VFE16_05390 [Candidatus Cybelea sp.]|jgi:hypothetical protein|nr:hypothetical protein [Candidatus Cybelea sp.]
MNGSLQQLRTADAYHLKPKKMPMRGRSPMAGVGATLGSDKSSGYSSNIDACEIASAQLFMETTPAMIAKINKKTRSHPGGMGHIDRQKLPTAAASQSHASR